MPNCSTPPFFGSFFITWTRWPAVMSSQSSDFAVGMNSCSAFSFFSRLAKTSPIRYFIRSKLSRATASIGPRLPARTEPGRSHQLPFFRNLGLKPAYGPNSREVSPSTTRVSRCGTDIGGAPTAALP